MLLSCSIKELSSIKKVDEIWLIVRSLKNTPVDSKGAKVYHVPQLAPSMDLFHKYCNAKQAGKWNKQAFEEWYVPAFIAQAHNNSDMRMAMNKLYCAAKDKDIAIACFCPEEDICHRSILLGLMSGMYKKHSVCVECRSSLDGVFGNDYERYFKMYEEYSEGVANKGVDSTLVEQHEGKYPTMGFTGRRPKHLFGYSHEPYKPIVALLKVYIKLFHEKFGTVQFITGGAQGFDQLAFWAVNSCKKDGLPLKNILYLPFPGQDSTWAEKGAFSKEEFRLMTSLADEVRYCSKESSAKAYHYRNHCMTEDSDIMLALHPDTSWEDENVKGGTEECLRYIKSVGKPFLQISPDSLSLINWQGIEELEEFEV